jgi:ribonucleoside-diphosphate reductase alpha chain
MIQENIRESILAARYYWKNESGEVTENWDMLSARVAKALAKSYKEQDEFYNVIHNRLFLPNTPALINAGRHDFSLSACFVLPVEDSMSGIFDAVKQAALVHKMGGGTGFDFSRLRPEGSTVKTTSGIASGPCSFIRVFDTATEVLKQGGTRRGANIGILRVDHPDIMKFISIKEKEGVLANFNLSVAVTDEFMEALAADGEYALRFGGKEYGKLKAREVWNIIVEGAWRNGEPGVVFIDTMNADNPTPHVGRIEATNPCVTGDTLVATPSGFRKADTFIVGDEVTTAYGTTGKIERIEVHQNMDVYEVAFSDRGKIKATLSHQFYATNGGDDKYNPMMLKDLKVGDIVHKSVGDNARIINIAYAGKSTVYDLFEPTTDTWITNGYVSRGCGEQPLLPYEACCLGSVNLSEMVEDNGVINWEKLASTVKTGVRMLDNIIDIQAYPLPEVEAAHKANRKIGLGIMGWADMLIRMNIPYSSDEATGLAELIMNTVSTRAKEESEALAERDGVFPNWKGSVWQKRNIRLRNATLTTIAPTGSISIIAGCSSGIEPVYDWVTVQKRPVGEHKVLHPLYEAWVAKHGNGNMPEWFEKTADIPPERHVAMQAAFQRHTHNAVSKTVNLPNKAAREDVDGIFRLAYESGCKGITVYRDGSRAEQVISSVASQNTDKETKRGTEKETGTTETLELRTIEESKRVRVKTGEGNVYVHITLRDEKPVEVFVNTPTESRYAEVYEAFARVFSVAIRHRVPVKLLLEQLERANERFGSIVSPVYAVLKAFRLVGFNGEAMCPECKGTLVPQEGCLKCPACGYSRC